MLIGALSRKAWSIIIGGAGGTAGLFGLKKLKDHHDKKQALSQAEQDLVETMLNSQKELKQMIQLNEQEKTELLAQMDELKRRIEEMDKCINRDPREYSVEIE